MYAFNKRFRPTLWAGYFTTQSIIIFFAGIGMFLITMLFIRDASTAPLGGATAVMGFVLLIVAIRINLGVRTERIASALNQGRGDQKRGSMEMHKPKLSYQSRYTWKHGIALKRGDVMHHHDGSISCAFVWDGFETSLKDQPDIEQLFQNLHKALGTLSHEFEVTVENHFLRYMSDRVIREYLDYGEAHMVRHHDFGMRVRHEMANELSKWVMDTKLITVITLERQNPLLKMLFGKRHLQQRDLVGNKLIDTTLEYMMHLKGAKLLSYEELEAEIWGAYHRDRFHGNAIPDTNSRFSVNQRLASKPSYDNGYLKLGDTYTKTILLVDYPDAKTHWFYPIARNSGVDMHITQVIKPVSITKVMAASALETKKSLESANMIGGEDASAKVDDHNAYRNFLAKNELQPFKNTYMIKLHCTDRDHLDECARIFNNLLGKNAIAAENSAEMSYSIWRTSQIGQGHKSAFARQDHILQIVNMAPVISFNRGNKHNPQMLRMTSDCSPLTYGYSEEGGNHALTAAKTGAGKGVDMVCEIAELFPLGIDFYLIEVGASYKWVVEAFGGDYFHLDSNTVISPFPSYAMADRSLVDPLDGDIVGPTIGVLMPLLSKSHKNIEQHILSVAMQVMQAMYRSEPVAGRLAPSMGTFFDVTASMRERFDGVQAQAVTAMYDNLNSFLSGVGKNFRNADSLNFDAGIVGLDFKKVMDSPELAKLLMVFVAMRFKQIAFSSDAMARICIDEMHKFIAIDAELIKVLMEEMTRTGRKEAGAFHAISQETMDAVMGGGAINQMSTQNFLYLKSGHEHTAKIFNMSKATYERWKSFPDPESIEKERGFRQGIKIIGDHTYDLHLRFPPFMLNLANTKKSVLTLKQHIGEQTVCPFERMELLEEAI